MDLNADLGEGSAQDALLMPLIARANIACGAHAGDPITLAATLRRARTHGVQAGAHPGYPDRAGFGRTETGASPAAIEADCTAQLLIFRAAAAEAAVPVAHVKPHGALYHRLMRDGDAAEAFLQAVTNALGACPVMGLPGSVLARQAGRTGIGFIPEMFADRRYEDDGGLTPRGDPRALIETLDEALAQVASVRDTGHLRTRTGHLIQLRAETVCVHGDSPAALLQARALARFLKGSGAAGSVEGA